MGIGLDMENHDREFACAKHTPLIINDIIRISEDEKTKHSQLIYTTYTGDVLSNLPSCECGAIKRESDIGVRCDICDTVVTSKIEEELEPLVWIRAPKGVTALINPDAWLLMSEKFTKPGFEPIRWICDTSYQVPPKHLAIVDEMLGIMEHKGLRRGLNGFYERFEDYLDMLFNLRAYRGRKKVFDPTIDPMLQLDPLHRLLLQKRDCVFCKHIPLINRALLVLEENTHGTFYDPIITGAIDAIHMMEGIDTDISPHSQRVRENRAVKVIAQLAVFYENIIKDMFAGKTGLYRKHIFGSRSHFSFRAVISSLTARHNYLEIHIPWGIGISVFRIHLANKLKRRGFSPNEIAALLNGYAERFHPLIAQLFEELLHETGNPLGVSCLFQRNPSLERGSAQAGYISKIKTDVLDPSVSISILDVKGLNADFDGDQINFTLSLDYKTEKALEPLAPHKSTFDLNSPRKVSSNLSMPKPAIATQANWLEAGEDDDRMAEKLARFEALPEAA